MGWPSTGPLPALSFFLLSFLLVPSNVCQAGDYVHPGIIVSRAQLDAIRADVHVCPSPFPPPPLCLQILLLCLYRHSSVHCVPVRRKLRV
eukprot:COSAG01_NODE_965_length_12401_cov_3.496098_5_plen_90_part_00